MEFDNLENITKQLWGAANSRSICSLKLEGKMDIAGFIPMESL